MRLKISIPTDSAITIPIIYAKENVKRTQMFIEAPFITVKA